MDALARPGHSGRHGPPVIRPAPDAAAARRVPPQPAGGRRAANRYTSERPGKRPGPSPPAAPRDQWPGPPARPNQLATDDPGASAATHQRKDHRAEAGPQTRHTPFSSRIVPELTALVITARGLEPPAGRQLVAVCPLEQGISPDPHTITL